MGQGSRRPHLSLIILSFLFSTSSKQMNEATNMVKEVEGTHQIGDVSLYTKSWLVGPPFPNINININ